MSVDYTTRALLKLIDCLFFQVDNRYILEVDNTNAEIIKQHKYIRTFIFYKECFFFLLDPLPPSGCLILSRSVTVKRNCDYSIFSNETMIPLAKSRDLRYGSIVNIADLYSGEFSRGFLQHNN